MSIIMQCVIYLFLWTELNSLQIPVLSPHPQYDVFGNRTFTEVTTVKWGHEGSAIMRYDSHFL